MATLEQRIRANFTETTYKGDEETEKELTDLVGKKCRCYDEGIDDGVDDDECEDCYIYYSAFEFEDSQLNVIVYYGDQTSEICDVEVRNAA